MIKSYKLIESHDIKGKSFRIYRSELYGMYKLYINDLYIGVFAGINSIYEWVEDYINFYFI